MKHDGDEYGRGEPATIDFYHGASAVFDVFRQDKILLAGASGASENGRGTYFTDTRQQAEGWAGRNGTDESVVLRISVAAETVKNSFIEHEHIFSRNDLVNLAVHAALGGFYRAMDAFADLAERDHPVTGKDIATHSKYNSEINDVLSSQGFKGFTYSEEKWDGSKIGNIVFFDVKDIPATVA